MLRASAVVAVALASQLGVARAQNSEDVIAGSDVALTGDAVVANVHTGGALWFNPAGVARLDSRSVDLTAAVLSYSIVSGGLQMKAGLLFAFAAGVRYAHGSGDLVGFAIPASFQVPIIEQNIVRVRINQIGINLAIKAAF